jgi:predicted metalloenzyme YecM
MKTVKDREYSFNHTKKRLKERYDIDITMEDYDHICFKVKNHKDVKLIMAENKQQELQFTYDYLHNGEKIRVVWSDERDCITTALQRS